MGFNPVSVYISHEYVRAVRGGTGEAKTTANYAGTVHVAEQVRHLGYEQVLWLDAIERRYVEEVGAMNIMFVRDGKHIITPALSGSILHGITRESVLQLGPDLGYTVSEEKIDVDEMLDDIEKGRITEAFGVGTAAVVAPVGKFGYKGKEYRINDEQTGPVAQHLFTTLTDIQFGRAPDPYGWVRQIKVDWRISNILRWVKHANTFKLEIEDLFSSFELQLPGLNKTDSCLRDNFLFWGDAQMQ